MGSVFSVYRFYSLELADAGKRGGLFLSSGFGGHKAVRVRQLLSHN